MPTDKIIVALDMDRGTDALDLVRLLKPQLSCFKVGKQLFTREGPALLRDLRALGVDIFLDLKFHDIPQTVAKAVKAAVDFEVKFLTLHTSGGGEMLEAAVAATGSAPTQLLGVTVLTSLDDEALKEIGFDHSTTGQVLHLARLAIKHGVNGLVCSPLEIEVLRRQITTPLALVTPGIRTGGENTQDQKRILSAQEALQRGASHLVVGRPITQAPDPVKATTDILASCGL